MIKKKIAEKIYGLLNLYSDYIESGERKNTFMPDFSFMDIKKKEKFPVSAVSMSTEKPVNKKRIIIEIGELITECNKCCYDKEEKKVYGLGNVDAQIVVITLPPTIEEASIGRPLSNEAVSFFKKWLSAISLDLKDVFITNIIKCPPKEKLTKSDIENCLKILDKELEILNPKIILSLGQLTISSLRKEYTNLAKTHGLFFQYNDILLFPTYHPADVLKNSELKKIIWEDLKKFKKKLEEIL